MRNRKIIKLLTFGQILWMLLILGSFFFMKFHYDKSNWVYLVGDILYILAGIYCIVIFGKVKKLLKKED
ncbi:hypothetical protein KY067_000618 [Listeria monocytogenes]|nr:hypothetical protein [Listeria monocytogenes serotype 1/2a]EHT9625517.1 hypothetical protein [Listeria monocytogenes]EKZ3830376.1 hypothetical protein [Listeria monocytogenes]